MLELVLEYGNKILAQLGKREIEKKQKGNFPSVQQIKQIVAVWSVRGAGSTDVPCSFRSPTTPLTMPATADVSAHCMIQPLNYQQQ